jgi:hypothetical protein
MYSATKNLIHISVTSYKHPNNSAGDSMDDSFFHPLILLLTQAAACGAGRSAYGNILKEGEINRLSVALYLNGFPGCIQSDALPRK